jgi:hypothetical protein
MTTPTLFTRTASAKMYTAFDELALQLKLSRPRHAINRDSNMSSPMVTTPDDDHDRSDDAGACDGVFKRTRSAGRQHAGHICTSGGKNEQRTTLQVRFEPYKKCHVHVRSDPRKVAQVPSDSGGVAPPFVNGEIPRDFFKRFGQAIRAEREAAVNALPEDSPTFSRAGTPAQPLQDARRNRFMRP